MENKPVLKRLRKKSKLLCKQIETIRLFEDQEEEEEEENSDSSMNDEDENDSDVEIETKEEDMEDVGPSSEPKKRKRKVRSKREDNSHGLNDKFFSLEAMERFADQEEALMRGEIQEEENDQDWMNAMYGATPKQNFKPEAGGDARYDEFFAPPEKWKRMRRKKKKKRTHKMSQHHHHHLTTTRPNRRKRKRRRVSKTENCRNLRNDKSH